MSNPTNIPQPSKSPDQSTSVNQLLGMVTQSLYHHSIRIRKVMHRDELDRNVSALNQTVQEYLDRKRAIENSPPIIEPVKPPPDESESLQVVSFGPYRAEPLPPPKETPLEETAFFKDQTRRMTEIGTGLWRLRLKMIQPGTDQPLDEFRRTYRHLQSIWDVLQDAGYTIQDHTGQPFDIGMDLKVITYEQKPGIKREMISETIKPSIYYQREGKTLLLQMGEVIVATPEDEELIRP